MHSVHGMHGIAEHAHLLRRCLGARVGSPGGRGLRLLLGNAHLWGELSRSKRAAEQASC